MANNFETEERSRAERLREASRKLLMEFADEDDGIARPLAAMARTEKRVHTQLDEPPKP